MKILPLIILLFAFINPVFPQGFTNISSTLNLPNGYQNGEYGGGVSFVDFNQDGLDDLTFPSGGNTLIHFYQNTGSGFAESPTLVLNTSEVKQVIWVDYDNDGDLDLYTTSSSLNRLYKNTGDLNFEDITPTCGFNDPLKQSFCGSWLDYDEDGLLDLCISHRISHLVGNITLYRNLGNDQFQDVTALAGLSNLGNSVLAMATFDMNNDGWEDIYVGQDYQAGNLMLKNNGDGTFDNISVSSNSNIQNNTMTTTIGDYNGDGWMDIYLTNTSEGNSFLENQGDETFIEKAGILGVIINEFCWGAVFLDADNDMDLDLHISSTNQSFMFENPNDGLPFIEVTDSWGFENDANYSVGSAAGDYNGDGRVDFAENNSWPSLPAFWQNNFTENNYIIIDLQGTVSNSMAVGAVIDVFAGGIHQIRRVGCGEGFSSQNAYSQFFGLAENTLIDEINIKWPNGLESTLTDINANQRITIIENVPGAGCTDPQACNYDPAATINDGSCVYAEPFYDCAGNCINDTDSDGVCDELEILGCMDAQACNYDAEATDNDGSCTYAELYYDCSGNCLNDADLDGVCDELEITGCTESEACNFDPLATDNDGSCIFPELYYDCAGNCLNDVDMDGICDELEISGCMDSEACNYDSEATDDDGSCVYLETYAITGELISEALTPLVYTYPETLGSSYFWEITGGEILAGQGTAAIEVIWNMEGSGTLTVTETNAIGCKISVEILVNIITDVADLAENDIQIYPNPASEFLIIDLGNWFQGNVIVELFDTNGKKILMLEEQFPLINLDLQTISNGVYQLILTKEAEKTIGRIVVYR